MGCALKRVNPSVTCQVNRDLERLMKRTLVSIVGGLPPPWKTAPKGRRPYGPRVVAICCILRVALRHTYESIESYLRRDEYLMSLLRQDALPGHSVIHRGMSRLPMHYLKRVMRRIVWRLRRAGMTVAVDATGFAVTNRSMWFDIRIQQKSRRRDCLKLHIAIDVDTGLVHEFTITSWNFHDAPEFKRLMTGLPRPLRVLGDRAYSSHANCQLVAELGATPYLKFKGTAVARSMACPAWRKSLMQYQADPEGWMAVYHLRSIVEAVISSIKRTWGSTLRSQGRWNKQRELALKVLAYDIRQVHYNERARMMGVDLRSEVHG